MKYSEEMLELFIYWVNARDAIWHRRQMGLPRDRWTTDPILRNYHFCNTERERDRGTIEIRKVVDEFGVFTNYLPEVYTAARMFNSAATLRVLLQGGFDAVRRVRDNGAIIFNTAYVVSTCGESMDKIDYVERVVSEVKKMTISRDSCASAFRRLREVSGLGSFLAGQIVADLKNDRYLIGANDWETFSVMGPGSKKGLDFIFGPGTTEKTYEERISSLATLVSGKIPKLHRQDLQNCLCEFSKYMRVKRGGHVRNKYAAA